MNRRTRFVYLAIPLPPLTCGGGSVNIDGKEVPIVLRNWWEGTMDRRRWKRLKRRDAGIPSMIHYAKQVAAPSND